jgi:ABC-2 type transport system permease protein
MIGEAVEPIGAAPRRYVRVYGACLRNCLARELEFRASFAFSVGSTIMWSIITMALSGVIFSNVRQVAGWDLNRMFVLTGTFLIVDGLTAALIQRNMKQLADMVNKGELDFVLTRPISSQFLVSVRYIDFADLPTSMVGVGYVLIGINRLGIAPGPLEIASYVLLVGCAFFSVYALWFMSVTLVLWTGRINNISALMGPVIDMARQPSDVYRGFAKPLLTYGLPVAVIATLPVKALLGALDPLMIPYQIGLTLVLVWLSHVFWHYSLQRYSSASS